ncbi:hypothetical protein ACNKHL_23470 [Shigella flexneri]
MRQALRAANAKAEIIVYPDVGMHSTLIIARAIMPNLRKMAAAYAGMV